MFKKVLSLFPLLLSGCAYTTSEQLANDTQYRITANGGGFVGQEGLKTAINKKAKELCGSAPYALVKYGHHSEDNMFYLPDVGVVPVTSGQAQAIVNCLPEKKPEM